MDSSVLVSFELFLSLSQQRWAGGCYWVVSFLSFFIQVSEVVYPRLGWAAFYFMQFAGWMKELDQTFSCDQGLDVPGFGGR